ncbi:MAG TPA: TonB-dependent receptor plug domain-containing protein, partial [Pyrinomonadaceae bacterium]|nr:TonB-dependent receptor plug domain-containing protein [Pyrinomonadaceae bacterium]
MKLKIVFNKEAMRYRIVAIAFVLCSLSSLVFASDEVVISRVSGQVIDQNGAAVVGARLVAERFGTTVRTDVITDADGAFKLDLARGLYVLRVAADGFEPLAHKVELLNATENLDPIVLSIAAATASVMVSDESGYAINDISTATKTYLPLRDIPQAITVVKREQIADQNATSISDIVRYVPGVSSHQGENNRDQLIIRGQSTSADFYRDGVRDDVQYYRDPYNMDRFEALQGPNAMIFGRGGGGGVVNRVTKSANFSKVREFTATGGSFADRRFTGDFGQPLSKKVAFRVNGLYEGSNSFRKYVSLEREGINPTVSFAPDSKTSINIGYEFFRDRRTADRGITSYKGRPANVPIDTFYGDPKQAFVKANVNMLSGTLERLFGDVIFRSRTHYG